MSWSVIGSWPLASPPKVGYEISVGAPLLTDLSPDLWAEVLSRARSGRKDACVSGLG